MTPQTQLPPTKPYLLSADNHVVSWLVRHHIVGTFIILLIIDACVFGPTFYRTGMYIDDWSFFQRLHFCNHSWLDYLKSVFFDPRIIIRPAYTPYLATLYFFLHEKPLVYNLINQVIEVSGAFFLYMALSKILKDRFLSFIAAVLFLIYPSHSVTHHSISAASTPIAVTFFTISLWLFAYAIELRKLAAEKNNKHSAKIALNFICLSAFIFLLSLFNYEICLSLLPVYTVVAAILLYEKFRPTKALWLSVLYTLPFFLAIGITVLYRVLLLPALGSGFTYRTVLDPNNFFHVLCEGIKVSVAPYAFSFFTSEALQFLREEFDFFHLIMLVAVCGMVISAKQFLSKVQPHKIQSASILAITLGTFILLTAYIIFGLTPDYVPVLDSNISRVNTASSIGASLLIAGCLIQISAAFRAAGRHIQSIVFFCMLLSCVILFVLADWQFAGPWIISWKAQQQVLALARKNAFQTRQGDTIILAGIPRYVMWASVFDGIWDFESALRITLNRSDIHGGVLSDRMKITDSAIEDRFKTFLCAKYPLKQIILLEPGQEKWTRIQSTQEFIDCAKKYNIPVQLETTKTIHF